MRFGKEVSKNDRKVAIVDDCVMTPSTLISTFCWVSKLIAVSVIKPKIALEIILFTDFGA
jgi:phosphoribosylpyrophosphate synthetase